MRKMKNSAFILNIGSTPVYNPYPIVITQLWRNEYGYTPVMLQ